MPVRESPDELTLRADEVGTWKWCINVDHIAKERWCPPVVDYDWYAFCQALFQGIEGEDWRERYEPFREMSRLRNHFGSDRRPTLWLEFPLTFFPFKVCLCRGDQRLCCFRWYKVPAMFRKMVGPAFLTAGLAATVASSVCGSRASVAADAGLQLQSPTVLRALLRQRPRPQGEIDSEEHVQCQSRPPLQRST